MKAFKIEDYKICIVGLGYVGLPLALRFSLKKFDVIGFDINERRVEELSNDIDRNNDIELDHLRVFNQKSKFTSDQYEIKDCNIFIVTVPTPINEDKTPNLEPVIDSSKLIGSMMIEGSIVVYESTVYPGVTDDICTPVLENESKFIHNKNFSTGYSPERIVPGDKINTIEKIKKIVSASNPKTLDIISFLYSSIIDAGIHKAPSIKVAEAAKVTENIQRDVNIALINEMHQLYTSIGINTNDVIEAASTKWNFMKLTPGMVGGHCISIDPYYLMHKSLITGYIPNLMRAARKVNDEMEKWVFKDFKVFAEKKEINIYSNVVTILGYSFKENCNDTRNTKVKDLIFLMKDEGIEVNLWDPLISKEDRSYLNHNGVKTLLTKPLKCDIAVLCVSHQEVLEFLKEFNGFIYDYRKIYSLD